MGTETIITGLLRETGGNLTHIDLPIINGEVCDKSGSPLVRTDETTTLAGWPFDAARVYRNDGGREILLPEETETVSLVQDGHSDYVCYQVMNDKSEEFYLCDADGDKVELKEWYLLKDLGKIPAGNADAFFDVITKTAK